MGRTVARLDEAAIGQNEANGACFGEPALVDQFGGLAKTWRGQRADDDVGALAIFRKTAALGDDGFGVKLHAVDRQRRVRDALNDAVVAARRDAQAIRHRAGIDAERVVARRREDGRQSRKKAGSVVRDRGDLPVHENGRDLEGVDLYGTNLPARQTVAMAAAQSLRAEPYRSFLDALREAGAQTPLPEILPMPLFMKRAAELAEQAAAV